MFFFDYFRGLFNNFIRVFTEKKIESDKFYLTTSDKNSCRTER